MNLVRTFFLLTMIFLPSFIPRFFIGQQPWIANSISESLRKIESIPDTKHRKQAADRFFALQKKKDFPLFENDTTAVFLYQGKNQTVQIVGDHNSWKPSEFCKHIDGTNLFYAIMNFPADARIDYKFVLDSAEWILDPVNKRKIVGGFGTNSELRMPQYIEAPEIVFHKKIPHGTIDSVSMKSSSLGNERLIKIYTPPGYSKDGKKYPCLFVHDGLEFLSLASMRNVLDYCIAAKEIQPVVVVFVPPVDRQKEYWLSAQFETFFVDMIIPYIRRHYYVSLEESETAMMGASLGGVTAIQIAFNHSLLIGKCAGFSSAIQINEGEIIKRLQQEPVEKIEFYLDCGRYEGAIKGSDFFKLNKSFAEMLRAKGYNVQWQEFNEGHSWGNWRAHIDDVLKNFFPYRK